jgi:hypothetical protein
VQETLRSGSYRPHLFQYWVWVSEHKNRGLRFRDLLTEGGINQVELVRT